MVAIKEKFHDRTYRTFFRKWPEPARKSVAWLMPVELLGLVPCLVVFGLAQPNAYRTKLWGIGFDNKLNSNPNMVLYAYANYQKQPDIPLVWSPTITNLNVAISVISLFFLLTKMIMFIMGYWVPVIAVFVNVSMIVLYTVSVYGQIGPDYADPRYPAPAAWYFRYGCDMAKPYGAYQDCQMAQSSLGLAFYMLMVYLISLGFALWAMWPHPRNDLPDDDDDESSVSEIKGDQTWEMQSMKSPMQYASMPYTPRTQAFHTLDRTLPMRQNAMMKQQQQRLVQEQDGLAQSAVLPRHA